MQPDFARHPTRTMEPYQILVMIAIGGRIPFVAFHDYAHSLPIKVFRVLALMTPPIPNAGMILTILAGTAIPESLTTRPIRDAKLRRSLRLYKSSPRRCIGVVTNWTAAGSKNCAVLNLPDSVCRSSPNLCFTAGGRFASLGVINVGKLKDANIVMASRAVNRQ